MMLFRLGGSSQVQGSHVFPWGSDTDSSIFGIMTSVGYFYFIIILLALQTEQVSQRNFILLSLYFNRSWCRLPLRSDSTCQELSVLSIDISHGPSFEKGTLWKEVYRLRLLVMTGSLHCICSASMKVSRWLRCRCLTLSHQLLFQHN